MAIKHDWAIITATQTNRAQYDTNDINGANVSESTGLIATVDLMFGIIASPEMRIKDKYILKCMYDRVARKDGFKKDYSLDSEYLRITEDPNEPYQDSEVYVPTMGKITPTRIEPKESASANSFGGQIKPNNDFEKGKPKSMMQMTQSTPLDMPTTKTPPASMVRSAINITGNGLFDKK